MLSLFERFIQRLAGQIRYTAAPIREVLHSLSQTGEFAAFRLLQDTAASLSADGEFRTAWRQAVQAHRREWALSEREETLLLDFTDGLGTADIAGELRHCEQYTVLIRECLEHRREEARTRGRLYTALGLCGGSAAALLLL